MLLRRAKTFKRVAYEIRPWGDLRGLRKSHPEDKDELEGVVEWEPVDCVNGRLEDGQEGISHPVLSNKY